ncbi:MAG: hypothetical protein KAY32_11270 [Candidatus Eisenbacteria sp.]|nr:hypothetical protein [Candidatus Eisenbacteria bacterium]
MTRSVSREQKRPTCRMPARMSLAFNSQARMPACQLSSTAMSPTLMFPALIHLALISVALLLGAGLLCPAGGADTSWEILALPDHDLAEVCIRVGGDDAAYYLLDPGHPITLSLRGPGKLRLLTRHLPRDGRTGKRCYTLLVDRGGERVLEEPLLATQSRGATLCGSDGAPVGSSEETVVSFPAGRHRFRVTIEEPDKRVAVRFFRERKVAETEYINFAPRGSERVCSLVRPSGNEYPHYHFSAEQPLRLTVNGPTELIVRTRLDFAPDASGEAAYELEVFRCQGSDGDWELVETLSYTSEPLSEEEGRYAACPEIIPGKSRRYDLEVPAGNWCYELRPGGPATVGVTGRILIPKEDIAFGP